MVTFHNRHHVRRPRRSTRAGRVDLDAMFARSLGRVRMRLLVYRPGTTSSERLKVEIFTALIYQHGIFGVALIAAFVAPRLLFFIDRPGLIGCIVFSAVVASIIACVSWGAAKPTLEAAHGIRLDIHRARGGAQISGDGELFEDFAQRLTDLEDRELSPVDHEVAWAHIYEELAAVTTSSARQSQR